MNITLRDYTPNPFGWLDSKPSAAKNEEFLIFAVRGWNVQDSRRICSACAAAARKAEQPAALSSDTGDDAAAIEENRRREAEMQELNRRTNCQNSQILGDDFGLAVNGC